MTRQIAPDQIDSFFQAFVHVRETLRIIIPDSPSSLEKFTHSAVGFEVRFAGDVTAITTALDREKLRPVFYADEKLANTRKCFAFDFVIYAVCDGKIGHQNGAHRQRERKFNSARRDQYAPQRRARAAERCSSIFGFAQ